MLHQEIRRFHRSINSLRDFVDFLHTYLQERRFAVLTENAADLAPALLSMFSSGALKGFDAESSFPNLSEERLAQIASDKGYTYKTEAGKNNGAIIQITLTDKADKNFVQVMDKVSKAEERLKLLNNSSLLSLISTVELFFSEMFHAYFSTYSSTLIPNEKVFSFDDLLSFASVEDARQYYLSGRIEEVLRKSFADWIKALKEKAGLSMSYLEPDMPLLVETFQRRNLIVHNGGRVNTIYLTNVSKVSSDTVEGVRLGDDLTPDINYLIERTDLLEKSCLLVGLEMWKKVIPFDAERATVIDEIGYQNMLGGRWQIAAAVSEFAVRDKKLPERTQLVAQLNYWLCKKRLGQWSTVENEVNGGDFSGKSMIFQLGIAALKEQSEEFFRLLPKALRAEEITREHAMEFPIFEEMRADARFSEHCGGTAQSGSTEQIILADNNGEIFPA